MAKHLCNFITLDGYPCENSISGSSQHCSAGHPVKQKTSKYNPLPDDSNNVNLVESSGLIPIESILYAPLPVDIDEAEIDGAGF